jgi:hypothetical protein
MLQEVDLENYVGQLGDGDDDEVAIDEDHS